MRMACLEELEALRAPRSPSDTLHPISVPAQILTCGLVSQHDGEVLTLFLKMASAV